MRIRLFIHISLLAVLAAVGVWMIRQDLTPASQGGFTTLDGLAAAMYWFGGLSFALFSSVLYVILKRRSLQALVIAYLMAAGVAAVLTVGIVGVGQQAAQADIPPGQPMSQSLDRPQRSPSLLLVRGPSRVPIFHA
jgi:hypothetical protein